MAALEHRILTKVLKARDLGQALRLGLKEEHFKDPECKNIFRYLHQHWHNKETIHTLPSPASIKRRWQGFDLTGDKVNPDDLEDAELPALINDLKVRTFDADVRSIAGFFVDLAEQNPQEAVRTVLGHLSQLETIRKIKAHNLGVKDVISQAIQHYEKAESGELYGIPWPWDCLTKDTLGKRSGDFSVIYARMKQMKTWLMLYCAVYDYVVNRCRVMIWSREMNEAKMSPRIASLLAKVDYQLFKSGKLPTHIYEKACRMLEGYLEEEEKMPEGEGQDHRYRQLILLCGHEAPTSLELIKEEIKIHVPDVVYLDSFYHITTERMANVTQRWRQIAILAEDVKALAEELKIPIIAVHQANRTGGDKAVKEDLMDLADSDVIAREADLLMRVFKRRGKELWEEDYEVAQQRAKIEAAEKKAMAPKLGKATIKFEYPKKAEEETEEKVPEPGVEDGSKKLDSEELTEDDKRFGAELAIVLSGNREGVLNAFTIHATPGYNFEFISDDYSLKDIEKWIKEDEEEEKKPFRAAPKKPEGSPYSKETFKNFRKGG